MSDDGWGDEGAGDTAAVNNNNNSNSKACFKCNQEGHFSRECPNAGNSGGDGCRKCGESGHFARECPNPSSNGDGGGDGCRKCGESGHFARECPNKPADTCRRCGEEGHMARDCSQPETCRRCGEEGHKVAECSKEETTRQITVKDDDGNEQVREIYVPKEVVDEELFEATISSGINFSKYESIPIEVTGENVPAGINSFEEAGLRQLLLDNITKCGYKMPTPVQKRALPIVMAGRDLMACAQTGSGKTAAFLLPIIHTLIQDQADSKNGEDVQAPQAVIITPTRELAIQISNESRRFSMKSMVKTVVAYGGTSVGYQLGTLRKGCNILVATPGRLKDFVDKGKVIFEDLRYFILDEADRMLDMGFGPDIETLTRNPTMPKTGDRVTLMFSATFPEEVQRSAQKHLKDYLFLRVGIVGGACTDVSQDFFCLSKGDKREKLEEILGDPNRNPKEKVLIFVKTKKWADFLACHLCGEFSATSIHGDRLQRQREEALHDFKTGMRPILVATSVAARGLDIKGVEHVINYDMPEDIDEYVHRIGRTGRVGNVGKATSFFDPKFDAAIQGPLKVILSQAGQPIPPFIAEGAVGGGGGGGGGCTSGGQDIRGGGAADEEDEW